MKKVNLSFLLLLISISCHPIDTIAQQASGGTSSTLSGNWTGNWTSPSGYIYLAQMRLVAAGNNSVEGEINWTLVKSPPQMDQTRLGLAGKEFVSGRYDPASRILSIEGIRKDDPLNVIGLDKYTLVLSETGAALGGITWNHGGGDGLLGLTRSAN